MNEMILWFATALSLFVSDKVAVHEIILWSATDFELLISDKVALYIVPKSNLNYLRRLPRL